MFAWTALNIGYVQVVREYTLSREQASAAGDPCAVICPDMQPGTRGILFKITVAVAAENRHGQRIELVTGILANCCITYT